MFARARIGLSILAACSFCSVAATGQELADQGPSVESCIAHHKEGQVLRRQGQLLAAAKQLQSCLHPGCSSLLRQACGLLLEEVEAETPSIVLAAQSEGKDLAHVSVYEANALMTQKLTGQAIALDPGLHRLRFEAEGRVPTTHAIVLRVGEKNRPLRIALSPAASTQGGPAGPPLPSPSREVSSPSLSVVWDYVPFAVGVTAALSGAAVALSASSDFEAAKASCAPLCSDESQSGIRTKSWIADGLFVLSGVAFAYGTFRILTLDADDDTSIAIVVAPAHVGAEGHF